jgi:hypothetical protein
MNVNNVFSEIKPHSLEYEELLNRYIQSFPILKNKILTKLEKYFIPKNNIIEIPIVSSIENYEELKISDLIELGSYIEDKNKIMY